MTPGGSLTTCLTKLLIEEESLPRWPAPLPDALSAGGFLPEQRSGLTATMLIEHTALPLSAHDKLALSIVKIRFWRSRRFAAGFRAGLKNTVYRAGDRGFESFSLQR
jgi:hypothetical protein